MTNANLEIWVLVWLLAAAFLIHRHWRTNRGVGLVLTYVASFGANHWLAPALNLLPGNENALPAMLAAGTRQSALAMVMFGIGAEGVNWLIDRRASPAALSAEPEGFQSINPVVVNMYLFGGLFLYCVLSPIAHGLPSVNALVATGSTLLVIAIGLKCWNAWRAGRASTVWAWLLATGLLPLFTVATQGFLGYGMAAMATVFAFVAAFYGPRWKVLLVALVLGYVGLSVYVTYMRDRADIREVVWSGAGLDSRFDSVWQSLGEFEWFDVNNHRHLHRIDERLNQNYLIGAAVLHMEGKRVDYAHGSTIVDAIFAIVPRALWADKPMSAGSGDLVSIYTGIKFDRQTSVGIGQVLECYVNFGTWGVVIGFLLIGAMIATADRQAFESLTRGNVERLTLWYLPGLSLLQLGGSFVEVTSSAAAGLAMAALLRYVTRQFPAHRATQAEESSAEDSAVDAGPTS